MSAAAAGSAPLIIPRRLAIALLAEAQRAEGGPVHGVIGAREGVPVSVCPGARKPKLSAETIWAAYHSGAEPEGGEGRQLLISLDTKGVLQLRCWEQRGVAGAERELRIV